MEPRLRSLKGLRALAGRARRAHRRGTAGYARKPRQGGRGLGEEARRGRQQAQRLPGPAGRGTHHAGRAKDEARGLGGDACRSPEGTKALRARREQLEQLEHDADALLEHYAEMIPEALDDLTPEERRDVYKMMRLKVLIFPDGSVEVTGVFGGPLEVGASRSTKMEDSWLATRTRTTSAASSTCSTLSRWRPSTSRETL